MTPSEMFINWFNYTNIIQVTVLSWWMTPPEDGSLTGLTILTLFSNCVCTWWMTPPEMFINWFNVMTKIYSVTDALMV